ncbi:MAG: CBS domain-containing protein [Desulfocapsaceae bacterium]|nr:CBS domain-containing protein [Desulfocapsaceae bacterium]
MSEKKTIKDAIKRKFPVINIDDTLRTAIGLMTKANVSVLAVKVREQLVGLVTVSDVVFSLANGNDMDTTRVSSFMTSCEFDTRQETRNPGIQLDENEDAISAIKVMYEAGVNHIIISGNQGEPIGIVSSLELIKVLSTEEAIA